MVFFTACDGTRGQRALNLTSGEYVTPPPNRDETGFFNDTNQLRAAGVDLYARPSGEFKALDMRSWNENNGEHQVPPGVADPFADVDRFSPLILWLTSHALDNLDTNNPDNFFIVAAVAADKVRRLKPHEDDIHGTNVWEFKTHGGARGVLQISQTIGDPDKPSSLTIRYKLLQSAGKN